MTKAYFTFFTELPKRFQEIGSVFPSSRALSERMAEPVKLTESPVKILEVGPGTGPITRVILEMMKPSDQLTICEINGKLLNRLKTSLETNGNYQSNADRVRFVEGPVQQLGEQVSELKFDVIICSLPFLNFTPELADEIMSLFRKLLTPGGKLTFFEYVGIRHISPMLLSQTNRSRVKKVTSTMKRWQAFAQEHGAVSSKISVLNIPPARSIQLCFDPAPEAVGSEVLCQV
jgi:phospholipid N-methyltransferase